jgi:hypothetical protein
MSDYQHQRGTLRPFHKFENENVKEYFKRVLEEDFKEDEWLSNDEDPMEYLGMSDLYERYIFYKNKLHRVEDFEELDPYGDVQVLNANPDGTFSFEMRYYNGGTCLSEMIEESLEQLNK